MKWRLIAILACLSAGAVAHAQDPKSASAANLAEVRSLNERANAYTQQRQFAQAEPLYKRAGAPRCDA